MFVKSLVLLTALCVPYALAAVMSLYLPDGNGAPFTADPIGTDDSGHTTWLLDIGVASGTFTATQGAGTPGTLVAGSTDLHVFGGQSGAAGGRVDCSHAVPTASGAPVAASCAAVIAGGLTTVSAQAPLITLTPIPVQVSDGKSGTSGKSNGAGSLRLSLGGAAVSALAILGTAGAMLVRV